MSRGPVYCKHILAITLVVGIIFGGESAILVAHPDDPLAPCAGTTNTGYHHCGDFTVLGKVGVGTPNPGVNYLEIQATGSGSGVRVRTIGTGRAGSFQIDNPGNDNNAIYATTNGTFHAGNFEINNSANGVAALRGSTNGTGDGVLGFATGSATAVRGHTTGTGRAASFRIDNPSNSNNALYATTNGTFHAGNFEVNNPANSVAALRGSTNGTGDGVLGFATSSAIAVRGYTTGTGRAGLFEINNTQNLGPALEVKTNGRMQPGETTGQQRAAYIRIQNPLSYGTALEARTDGPGVAVRAVVAAEATGVAGSFSISSATNMGTALESSTNGTGWAARFWGTSGSSKGVYISAPAGQPGLQVAGGTKSAVVATSRGARVLYTEEATEVWFTDYGFSRLRGGRALVFIDRVFAETVNLDMPYHVFVQPYGSAQLYVAERTASHFEVRMRAGDPNAEFSYRIVAKRREHEQLRLERASWADRDPNFRRAVSSTLAARQTFRRVHRLVPASKR